MQIFWLLFFAARLENFIEQFLKKGALFLEKLNIRIFPLILLLKILSILSSFSGEKGSERFAEP